ncbi:MAG: ATP-binding protein [Phycisphaerales bacterium]
MPYPAEISVEVRSNKLYLSGMREMVASVARRLGFGDEACGQLALAVDEALCNVIKHGYGNAHDKPIWIKLHPLGGIPTLEDLQKGGNPTSGMTIVIEDEAKQVELSQIKSRNLEDIRPGGLGVHIIHEVMDEVKYERREGTGGTGMRLTMTKLRKPAAPGAMPTASGATGSGGHKGAGR